METRPVVTVTLCCHRCSRAETMLRTLTNWSERVAASAVASLKRDFRKAGWRRGPDGDQCTCTSEPPRSRSAAKRRARQRGRRQA